MGRAKLEDLDDTLVGNINSLVPKINQLLEVFGEYRKVSSGIRTVADHKRIYEEKNLARKSKGLNEIPVPMGSKHLSCEAIDLADPDGSLKQWLKTEVGIETMTQLDLYQEHPDYTPSWVHLQCVPPKSGSRVFKPY